MGDDQIQLWNLKWRGHSVEMLKRNLKHLDSCWCHDKNLIQPNVVVVNAS